MARPSWVDELVASKTGSTGNDTMDGTTGDDTISADSGNDSVAAEEGNDFVDAGEGNDTVYGDMGEGFEQGLDATPLVLDINNIQSTYHDGVNGSAGNYAIFSDVATLEDGTSVWGKLVLVEKSNSDLAITFGYTDGAEILLDGASEGDQATFRLEFYDPATGDPVYLNSTATWNDIDDNSGYGDAEAVIIDGNSFTSYGVSSDSSLSTSTDGNAVTATGSELNDYTDQDSWFSAEFEDKSSIEFTLQTRLGYSGFTLSGSTIDDPVTTPIEQGNDTVMAGDGDDVVYGQGGDDSLVGEEGHDELYGGDGSDTIEGGDGDDYIEGGAGNDSLSTGIGNDTLLGGEGDDTLKNSDGDDSLSGGVGNDSIVATGGNDTLDGGTGDDTMYGGDDNDLLIGGEGADLMYGEADADTFEITDNFGNDTLEGGEAGNDFDTVDLASVTSGVTVTYTGDEAGTITDGSDTITFSEIEQLDLTDQDDVLDASDDSAGVSIDAGQGDDTVTLGAGDDIITGGSGDDVFGLTDTGGADTITDFDINDDDNNGFFNDQLDVSDLTGGTGSGGAIRAWDVDVTDDGNGNALLSFPNGESLVLQGVAPAQISTAPQLFSAGIPCFTPSVRIATHRGLVRAGDIQVGDLLQTVDNGYQPVIWVAQKTLSPLALGINPHLRPYLITPDSPLCPERPMLVSPQHRLLIRRNTFETPLTDGEAFISAKLLSEQDTNCEQVVRPNRSVTYVHLMTERHEAIFAEGVPTETFWPGPQAIKSLNTEERAELLALFPGLFPKNIPAAPNWSGQVARASIRNGYGELARTTLHRRHLSGHEAA